VIYLLFTTEAETAYRAARQLAENDAEREFLDARLAEVTTAAS
jgi:predicted RNA polymerase sigma factor